MAHKKTTGATPPQPGTVPDLSSRELQAICTVAECGSFMAAALTLNISQPALTRIVQRVEGTLGLELFRRSTRKVEISPAGQEFVDLANRVLSDLSISYGNMQAISDEHRGSIIISSIMSVAYTQLPQIVAHYQRRRPNIEIQLREGIHGMVVEDVRSGVADLGITYLENVPKEFIAVELGSEVFHLVMPSDHPLGKKEGVRIKDLANTALVSMPRASHIRKLLDGLASVAGIRLHHAITVNLFATMMQFVRAGVGIALVPHGAVASALSAGLISRPLIDPKLERPVGVLSLRHRSPAPAAAGFLEHLQAHWNDPPDTGKSK